MKNEVNNKGKKTSKDPEKAFKYGLWGMIGVVAVCVILVIYFLLRPVVIVKIGDYKVRKDEFDYCYAQVYPFVYQYVGSQGEEAVHAYAMQYALNMAVETQVKYDKAKKDNYKVESSEINNYLSNYQDYITSMAQKNSVEEEEVNNYFFGMSFNKAKKYIEKQYIAELYVQNIQENLEYTESEMKAFYEENKEAIDQVTIRHILIKVEDMEDEDEKAEKKAIADEVLQKLKDGEDFDTLAEEYNEDTNTEYTFVRGDMVTEFEDWAFSEDNDEGDMAVVETIHGYHVMVHGGKEMSYELLTEEIKGKMQENGITEKIQAWCELPEYAYETTVEYDSYEGP